MGRQENKQRFCCQAKSPGKYCWHNPLGGTVEVTPKCPIRDQAAEELAFLLHQEAYNACRQRGSSNLLVLHREIQVLSGVMHEGLTCLEVAKGFEGM